MKSIVFRVLFIRFEFTEHDREETAERSQRSTVMMYGSSFSVAGRAACRASCGIVIFVSVVEELSSDCE